MSKVLKNNSVSLLQDDRYIISKKDFNEGCNLDCKDIVRKPVLDVTQETFYAQAEDILDRSRAQAMQILIEAQKEADMIKREAHRAGYSDGEAQGYEEGYNRATVEAKAKLDKELEEIGRLRKAIFDEKATILKQSEGELVMLALEIAEKVIDTELQNEIAYNNLIKKTLKNLKGRDTIKVYVSKEDFDRVSVNKGYITSTTEGLGNIEIIVDEYLTHGSCIVDGGIGVIDGSVDTQLKQIETALMSLLRCENSQLQEEKYA